MVAHVAALADYRASRRVTGETHKTLMSDVAVGRDKGAFRALFAHFGPRIKAVMMKSGADTALAEDLVQEVMMTVWRKAHLYHADRGSVSAWIFAVARNARINHIRKGSSRAYEDVDDMELVSDEPAADEVVYGEERADFVARAIQALPEDQRVVIEMAFMEDLSQSEISERLGLPLGTVKSRMRLAYVKMKGRLEAVQ